MSLWSQVYGKLRTNVFYLCNLSHLFSLLSYTLAKFWPCHAWHGPINQYSLISFVSKAKTTLYKKSIRWISRLITTTVCTPISQATPLEPSRLRRGIKCFTSIASKVFISSHFVAAVRCLMGCMLIIVLLYIPGMCHEMVQVDTVSRFPPI